MADITLDNLPPILCRNGMEHQNCNDNSCGCSCHTGAPWLDAEGYWHNLYMNGPVAAPLQIPISESPDTTLDDLEEIEGADNSCTCVGDHDGNCAFIRRWTEQKGGINAR